MRDAVELVRGQDLSESLCPLRKFNCPAPPEIESDQNMKTATFVQSSLPRTITTIATKVLVLILLAMAAPAAVGQLTFTITDLGPGAAYGINNNGQVVGNSVDAFIYSGGTM